MIVEDGGHNANNRPYRYRSQHGGLARRRSSDCQNI